MNSFFVPQLGSQIYTMAGMVDAPPPAGRPRGHLSRPVGPATAASGFADMRFHCRRRAARRRSRGGSTRHAAPARCSTPAPTPRSPSRARRSRPSPTGRSLPTCSTASWAPPCSRMVPRGSPIRRHRGRKSESPGQAQLGRDPARSADHHGRDGLHGPGRSWPSSAFITVKGYWVPSVARLDHLGRPQAHRRHVHRCSRWSCCCAASPTPS